MRTSLVLYFIHSPSDSLLRKPPEITPTLSLSPTFYYLKFSMPLLPWFKYGGKVGIITKIKSVYTYAYFRMILIMSI